MRKDSWLSTSLDGRYSKVVSQNLGKVIVDKGNIGKDDDKRMKVFYSWDVAEYCLVEQCPLCNRCAVLKGRERKKRELEKFHRNHETKPKPDFEVDLYSYKCGLQIHYLEAVYSTILDKMGGKNISREDILKMGYHMIPLYNQLFKMKLVEASLGFHGTMKQGKVHPVFKEIRDIIKTISTMWGDFNHVENNNGKNGKKEKDGAIEAEADSFYSLLIADDDTEEEAEEKITTANADELTTEDVETSPRTGKPLDKSKKRVKAKRRKK